MHIHWLKSNRLLPAILLSSFDEGRYNKPWSGGDWNEYQRGQNVRQWNENTNKDSGGPPNWNWGGGGNNNSGGGGGCLIIALFIASLIIIIPAAVTALILSIALLILAKTLLPEFRGASFGEVYKTAFWASCTYFLAAVILALLQVWLMPGLTGMSEEFAQAAVLKYFYMYSRYLPVNAFGMLIFHGICILATAWILQSRSNGRLAKSKGYQRAFVITALIILPAVTFTIYSLLYILWVYSHHI